MRRLIEQALEGNTGIFGLWDEIGQKVNITEFNSGKYSSLLKTLVQNLAEIEEKELKRGCMIIGTEIDGIIQCRLLKPKQLKSKVTISSPNTLGLKFFKREFYEV